MSKKGDNNGNRYRSKSSSVDAESVPVGSDSMSAVLETIQEGEKAMSRNRHLETMEYVALVLLFPLIVVLVIMFIIVYPVIEFTVRFKQRKDKEKDDGSISDTTELDDDSESARGGTEEDGT